jgi:hypothetical protein
MKDIVIESAKFVEVSTIVPDDWKDWFFANLSDNAPFSWGDNNRTLVSAERFKDQALDVLDMMDDDEDESNYIVQDIKEYKQSFLDTLSYLESNSIYIDLES